MTTVTITYRKNPLYTDQNTATEPRLFAELDLSGFGVETKVKNLAIYYRQLEKPVGAVRVVYTTYIAGLPLETGNLTRLKQAIDDTLKALIRFNRLPEYVFQVEDNAYPIYHLPGQLLTRYPNGLVFSADSIAKLRVQLADHFKGLGRIRNRHELGLLYLSPYDFKLYAPHCVVRIPGEENPDIPVFPDPNESSLRLIAPVNSISLSEAFDSGAGVLAIHKAVEKYLIEHNQLSATNETTVRKLKSSDWDNMKTHLTPQTHAITYRRETDKGLKKISQPVYAAGDSLITARINRLGGAVLFFAADLDYLQKCVGDDLASYGAVPSPDAVSVVAA
jgi:hypothetical protein